MMGSDQKSEFEEAWHHWKTVFFTNFGLEKVSVIAIFYYLIIIIKLWKIQTTYM